MNRICVVIPMFGKEEYTRKCVDLVTENYGTGEPIEILVVDDGSPHEFKDHKINVIRLEENSGFTKAANEGILWAQYRNADYVLLLNNDTEPRPNFLKSLVEIMENDPSVGIAGSIREYANGTIELCGADLIRGHQYLGSKDMDKKPIEVNWLPLCSALIRMDMIREIGILDKRFRNHCSDSWYCINAKMHGWKIILDPNSVVLHHLSVTTTSNNINVEHDQRLLLEKLACMDQAKLMKEIPLDIEAKTYGKLSFTVDKK